MNSLYDFIIEPIGDRYENKKQIEDKTLILNTSIETFKAKNVVVDKIMGAPYTQMKVKHLSDFRSFPLDNYDLAQIIHH